MTERRKLFEEKECDDHNSSTAGVCDHDHGDRKSRKRRRQCRGCHAGILPDSGWWDEGTSTSGYVTANASQDVYLESDSIVEKVYVKKGDKVKIGDTLLEYDKTLLQLKLEEEQINKQIQELELQGAKNDLEKLKKITPVADSEGSSSGVSPLDEPDDSSDDLDDGGADGYEEARAAIVKHNVSLVSTAAGADVQVIDGNSEWQ